MENSNNNSQPLTKDDLLAAFSKLMEKQNTQTDTSNVPVPKTNPQEDIISVVEKYLEKRDAEKKAQEVLARANNLSTIEAEEVDAELELSESPANRLESLRLQLEKHIDNIKEMLKYDAYDPALMDSKYTNKYINARRTFWHCICHNKGGKAGSEFILEQMRTKGIKHPSAYLLKY